MLNIKETNTNNPDINFWRRKKVLITGHTGFKGSWLSLWLLSMNAQIYGISLEPNTTPNLFNKLDLRKKISNNVLDIRDKKKLKSFFENNTLDLLIKGEIKIGKHHHQKVENSKLILLEKGSELKVFGSTDSKFLLIAGKPIGEQIARGGPFVMNTKQEILQAVEDYHKGTFVK